MEQEVFKKRERKIKKTRFYPGSPFLKGYVQSFANQQRFSLKRSQQISLTQYNTCTPQANPASSSNLPTKPYSSSSTSTEPTVLSNYNHTSYVICNNNLTVHESSMYRPTKQFLLKTDYKDINNRVETLSSAWDHCYIYSLPK